VSECQDPLLARRLGLLPPRVSTQRVLTPFPLSNPELMRLLAWSALEQQAKGKAERVAPLQGKIAKIIEAQKARQVGTAFPPEFLLVAVMSLATAWSVASPFAPSRDPKTAEGKAELRQSIVEAVRLLAAAGKGTRTPGRSKSR
jgi:hypothetical protein